MVAFQKPHNEEGGTGRINFLFLSCLGVIRALVQGAEESLKESHQGPSFKGCWLDHILG